MWWSFNGFYCIIRANPYTSNKNGVCSSDRSQMLMFLTLKRRYLLFFKYGFLEQPFFVLCKSQRCFYWVFAKINPTEWSNICQFLRAVVVDMFSCCHCFHNKSGSPLRNYSIKQFTFSRKRSKNCIVENIGVSIFN